MRSYTYFGHAYRVRLHGNTTISVIFVFYKKNTASHGSNDVIE